MNIVILLGAPGSGKGTIAGRLAGEDPKLKHVSSGDLLRGAVARGTPAGIEAKGYMDKGQLVPDALIAQMIKDVIAETEGDVIMLLDGFPRNVAQAEILEKTGVLCTPGSSFGPSGEGYVRMALVATVPVIEEALKAVDESGILK